MTPTPLTVLFEDNHCLVLDKPARLLTAGDETGDVSLLEMGREYLKQKYAKPGNVFLGVVQRLDRPVSGVVLFARTSKAASRLAEQFRTRTVRKVYHAIVEGALPAASGELVDWLLKNEEQNLVSRVAANSDGAKLSVLHYRRLSANSDFTRVEILPQTGRSHQIRVQLAGLGTPIYGDAKYGAAHRFDGAIALHAAELTFEHPVKREPITVSATVPHEWAKLLRKL